MSELLQNEIRATKPAAPDALRDRVRELAAQEPARAPFLSRLPVFQWRRLVLVVPAAAVIALGTATVIGLTRDDDSSAATRPDFAERRRRRGGGDHGAFETYMQGGADGPGRRDGAQARGARRPSRSRRGASCRPSPASSSATRPSCACASTTSTPSPTRPRARSRSRSTARRQRRLAPVRGARRGHRRCADHAPRPDRPRPERDVPALPARHDRRAALRDRGPAAAGRHAPDPDRADAAPDRADPDPARERDALRRDARRPPVAPDRVPAEADRPAPESHAARMPRRARRRSTSRSRPRRSSRPRSVAAAASTTSRTCSPWRRSCSSTPSSSLGPFVLLGVLVWLALRLRRRQVETRLLEQN